MRARLGVLGILGACAFVLGGAVPAHAGGSLLHFERDHYEPGERAVASGRFGPGCCDRGWLEHGPYHAWLVPYHETQAAEATLPNGVVPIGEVRLSQAPYQVNGQTYFHHTATVEFDVPELPPGRYAVHHCNDPCTKELGDITGAMLQVGAPPPTTTTLASTTTTVTSTSTTTTSPTTTTIAVVADDASPTTEAEESSKSPGTGALVAGGAVVAAGVTAVGALRWRRRREP